MCRADFYNCYKNSLQYIFCFQLEAQNFSEIEYFLVKLSFVTINWKMW